ncbi:MAG: methylated-DNA--[protein]-cysteine S-methyltransferase [Lentimicrobiaceae bacterium]|nr:methylated-DNA--[protein]-cysteine S-methyltransferase [Lentimicrobiaceae bacterium]
MPYYYPYQTPLGEIWIVEDEGCIVKIKYKIDFQGMEKKETDLIKKTCLQLAEYFAGKRKNFDIPIKLTGTTFQQRVWAALQTIPYGEVWSYKRLAETVGSPKGYRAVGMANNRNPISIIVPCHRVVGINGDLVGYAGGIDKKSRLLNIEQGNQKI